MKKMAVRRLLSSMMEALLDFLFPRVCPMCGRHIESEEYLCASCVQRLPRTEQVSFRGNVTEELFGAQKNFVAAAAYLFFEKQHPVQQLLHAIKYHSQPALGYWLAQEAARDGLESDFFDGIDVIIPVPLHPKRLRQRGYNQSEWIALGLSSILHIPVDTTHIKRIRNNPKQALLPRADRTHNVEDIFEVNHPEDMYRKHILLVDDIITTGATITSCMQAMRKFRGCSISVFALGKTRSSKPVLS